MQYTHGGDIWSCPAPVLDFSANLNPLGMPPEVKAAAEAVEANPKPRPMKPRTSARKSRISWTS